MQNVVDLRIFTIFNVSSSLLWIPECETIKVLQYILRDRPYSTYPAELIIPKTFRYSQLGVLRFEDLLIKNPINRDWISEALANCPLLETLVITSCLVPSPSLSKLCISFEQLQKLVLVNLNRFKHVETTLYIKITTPNLTSLEVGDNFYYINYSFKSITSLVEANIKSDFLNSPDINSSVRKMMELLSSLSSVKDLSLLLKSCCFYSRTRPVKVQPMGLNSLRCLTIQAGSYDSCVVTDLMQSCQHFETLIIETADSLGYCPNPDDLHGSLDHVKTFQMENFRATKDNLILLKALLKHARILEKVMLTVENESISFVDEKVKKRELTKLH